MKNYLQSVWLALLGRLSIRHVVALQSALRNADANYKDQLSRANEAAKLYNEGEIGRKAASDALGNKVIMDIKQAANLRRF